MTAKSYSVSELARMAGVSVRTLHYYDKIGLLRPSARTEADYRRYGEAELLRLQQILFYKELGLSLAEIGDILNDPEFDLVAALRQHRALLQQRAAQLSRLLKTVDRTIHRLTEKTMKMTDEELYEGFSRGKAMRYQQEAREMYDPAVVEETEKKLRKLSKAEWEVIKAEGDAITRELAALMERAAPEDPEVQAVIARHHAWIERFFRAPADVYRGLAKGYAGHPEFRAFYDHYAEDLADFLSAAMHIYAERLPAS